MSIGSTQSDLVATCLPAGEIHSRLVGWLIEQSLCAAGLRHACPSHCCVRRLLVRCLQGSAVNYLASCQQARRCENCSGRHVHRFLQRSRVELTWNLMRRIQKAPFGTRPFARHSKSRIGCPLRLRRKSRRHHHSVPYQRVCRAQCCP